MEVPTPITDLSNVTPLKLAPRSDLDNLHSLLALPPEVHTLGLKIAVLRDSIDLMRKALPPLLLSVAEAARSLDVSEVTVRRMIREAALAHVRIGRSMKVDLTRTRGSIPTIRRMHGLHPSAKILVPCSSISFRW